MSIVNYRSLIRRIDRQHIDSLEQFLSIPLTPMVLSEMNHYEDRGEFITRSVEQLVARTSRCYEAFSFPVMSNSLRLHSGERLKWAQNKTLREFKQCLALRELVKEYVSNGQHLKAVNTTIERDTDTFPSHSTMPNVPESLRTTSDQPHCTLFGKNESPSRSERVGASDQNHLAALPPPSKPFLKPITEELFSDPTELLEPENLSFELALEILRPKDSILDVLINEASIRSDLLNDWFYYYCQQRVAWRVLHEHLLFLTRPDLYPRVVHHDVQLLDLLETVGNIVAEIYANLAIGRNDLIIHVEEDPSILEHPPPRETLVGSSSPLLEREGFPNRLILPSLSSSSHGGIVAVADHLLYVFRELIKNACAATIRVGADLAILVRFAVGEEWVVVEVVDRAGGIPPPHAAEIWKFGWTTHRYDDAHLGGFGVGLPISKVYMDVWGGAIDVYSIFHHGSTIRVRFPKSPVEVLASSAKLTAD